MQKIKRQSQWDNCVYALFPFGKGFPICAYGVKHKLEISIKDFYHCMPNGKCRKEEIESEQRRSADMSMAGTMMNSGNRKTKIKVTDIRENPLNFYEKEDIYKKTIDKETGQDIELVSLAEGIKENGQMHNVVVYEDTTINDGKKYTLISGARRYKATLWNYEKDNTASDVLDALIIPKPSNPYEEQMLIIEGNKQRRREFQSKQTAYQEVLAMEQIFDEYKKSGMIPKGQVNKRKFVAASLGISEGTVENLHHQFDKTEIDEHHKKKARKANKASKKKEKYNELADDIQAEVAFACDKVKLNEKELIFAYESFEDLKHLLDAFSINVDVKELEEWLKQNL